MARPTKFRRVEFFPKNNYFVPWGKPKCEIEEIVLKIEDISFLVFGCPASIATSSMTTELSKKKSLEEVLEITEDHIINVLGGLPENKKHCSNLGVAALRNAIEDYYKRKV